MRGIDIHAHLRPQCYLQAMAQGKTWHVAGNGRVVYKWKNLEKLRDI
jgi:hypothetical protein